MSIPSLNDLIVSVDGEFPAESSGLPLTVEQVNKLELISDASSQAMVSVLSGLAAVGELIAVPEEDEISHESLIGVGWLVHQLAGLAGRLHEETVAANHKLHCMKRAGVSQ